MWVNDVRMWSAAHAWQRTGRLLAVVSLSFHYQREWEKRIHCSQGIMNIDSSLYPWTNIFIMAIDSGHSVILVLVPVLDSSATFDTVDHGILLTWLSIHFVFGSMAVQWLMSYLPDPTHCVKVNGTSSRSLRLIQGVLQGSITLFFTYITFRRHCQTL